MSWSTSELRVRLAPLNRFKPSSKIFYWPFQGGTSFVDLLCFCSVLCLLCFCARLFICALWSPAGKGLTSWLSIVVSNCEFVTFPLVSWVSCGIWLYRFLIFAPLLTFFQKETVSDGEGPCQIARKGFVSSKILTHISVASLLLDVLSEFGRSEKYHSTPLQSDVHTSYWYG